MNGTKEPHPITRARERYGLEITMVDLRDMQEQCLDPRTIMGGRPGNKCHLVLHKPSGTAMRAIFDEHLQQIVTFKAPDHRLINPSARKKPRRRKGRKGRSGSRLKRQPRPDQDW